LAEDARRGVARLADDREGAGALAVEREALRVARRDEEVDACGDAELHSATVFYEAVAEPLVRQVEKGNESARREHVDDLLPLRCREVAAGRVVTAGVEDDDRSRGSRVQRRHQ